MKSIAHSISKFWKKGKWHKFIVIIIIFVILGVIADLTGISYKSIDEIISSDIEIKIGETKKIDFSITPEDYEVKILSTEYKVDDNDIAKIEDNVITGIAEGETKFRIIIKDDKENTIESKKYKITVSLTEEQVKAQEEAEQEKKRNTISIEEAIRIQDYCKQIINSILKSPSSAEYPGTFLDSLKDWSMVKKNNLVTVSSYVDAQNSFGTMIRSYFTIQIQMDDEGNGNATYVEFDGEILKGTYQN